MAQYPDSPTQSNTSPTGSVSGSGGTTVNSQIPLRNPGMMDNVGTPNTHSLADLVDNAPERMPHGSNTNATGSDC